MTITICGKEIPVYTTIPDSWRIDEGATTAPRGYVWINNGKSRFGGEYQQVLYRKVSDKQAAADFVAAVAEVARKPENLENLENLENYLSRHFSAWLEKYAGTPEDIAAEMQQFAQLEI